MKLFMSIFMLLTAPMVLGQVGTDSHVVPASPSGVINKRSEGVSNPNTQKVETQEERQEEKEDSFKVGPYKDGKYKYFDKDEREDTPLP